MNATGNGASTDPSSHSRESGFQSATSLTSLEKTGGNNHGLLGDDPSPISTLDSLGHEASPPPNGCQGSQVSADSMVSLISGLSDSASNAAGSSRYKPHHSNGDDLGLNLRRSVVRRSARLASGVGRKIQQQQSSLLSEELRSVNEDGERHASKR